MTVIVHCLASGGGFISVFARYEPFVKSAGPSNGTSLLVTRNIKMLTIGDEETTKLVSGTHSSKLFVSSMDARYNASNENVQIICLPLNSTLHNLSFNYLKAHCTGMITLNTS